MHLFMHAGVITVAHSYLELRGLVQRGTNQPVASDRRCHRERKREVALAHEQDSVLARIVRYHARTCLCQPLQRQKLCIDMRTLCGRSVYAARIWAQTLAFSSHASTAHEQLSTHILPTSLPFPQSPSTSFPLSRGGPCRHLCKHVLLKNSFGDQEVQTVFMLQLHPKTLFEIWLNA